MGGGLMTYLRDLVFGTTREVLRFDGRARIVDLIYLGLLLGLIGFLLRLPIDRLPWDLQWYAGAALDVLMCVPFAALAVRRLHDQDLSGWWMLALLPMLPIDLYQSYRATFAVLHPEWLTQPDPLDPWKLPLFPIGVAIMVLGWVVALRPGTRGPNRYGPDPREEREVVPA